MAFANRVRVPVLGIVAALGLSACVTPAGEGYGPPLAALPDKPIELDAYAWLDRSDALLDAISDSPPDYIFDQGGRHHFAWNVDGVLIVEETGPDGYVLYLYDEGEESPFFIRTPDFAAGFDGEDLAVIYTREGEVLVGPDAQYSPFSVRTFFARSRGIRQAARQSRWDRDAAQAWVAVEAFIYTARDEWERRWRADRDWERYRVRAEADASRARLEEERRRRRDDGRDFRRWREGGFNGAPPRRRDRDGEGRADRPNRPDRPRDREDRSNRPNDGVNRPDRPRDDQRMPPVTNPRPERPQPRPPEPITADPPATTPELRPEPAYRPAAPDRLSRPRVPDEAPPPRDSSAIISREELLRSEAERDRRAAEELARVQREQEAAARARREAEAIEAAEGRRQDERRRMRAVEETQRADEENARQARAAEEAEQARRQAEAEEARQRQAAQEAERAAAQEAERQSAAQAEADAERQAQAQAAEAARRREAEQAATAEAARRQAEQNAAAERDSAERRRRLEESTLEPQ